MSKEGGVLIIGGKDASAEIGLDADLKTMADFGVEAFPVATAKTKKGIGKDLLIQPVGSDSLTRDLSAACRERKIKVVKVGLITTLTNVKALIWFFHHQIFEQIVIDPVLHSSSGIPLLETKALEVFRQQLLPLSTVITPNIQEASVLAGMKISSQATMKSASETICIETKKLRVRKGRPLYIFLKGGNMKGDVIDLLFDGERHLSFTSKHIPGTPPRGIGCRFSSAIAASLALGFDALTSVKRAREYVTKYISESSNLKN